MLPVPASTPITDMRNTSRAGAPPRLRVVSKGISLIELMIGMTIGLIALLVMMQTFSASEGQKRNTVSGADTTMAGHVAIATLERDLLSAGAGMAYIECPEIRMYRPGATPGVDVYSAYPVQINPNTATPDALRNRSDVINIQFGSSSAGITLATIQDPMPSPSSVLFANNGIGFANGDMVLLSEPPKHCVVLQLTGAPGQTGKSNITSGGSQWRFQANPSTGVNPPAAGGDLFPTSPPFATAGYQTGARIISMGALNIRRYSLNYRSAGSVPASDLQFTQLSPGVANPTAAITNDVIALRAQYGWWDSATGAVTFSSAIPAGADPKHLAAVRVGIVARASSVDRGYTAPETIRLFDGANAIDITLSADERNYRYRTFETIVPLRNTIWNR